MSRLWDKSHLLSQLEIRAGHIWILTDNTEEGIATELVTAGVPKDQIVLWYYSPTMREMGSHLSRFSNSI